VITRRIHVTAPTNAILQYLDIAMLWCCTIFVSCDFDCSIVRHRNFIVLRDRHIAASKYFDCEIA
jgi:hypothetical protein